VLWTGVIPAQAGIQRAEGAKQRLDPGFRRGDEVVVIAGRTGVIPAQAGIQRAEGARQKLDHGFCRGHPQAGTFGLDPAYNHWRGTSPVTQQQATEVRT
jgi:hypothetical protein